MKMFAKRPKAPKNRQNRKPPASGSFHAVQITPGLLYCCAAVKQISAQRLLSKEAPIAPLSKCDRPELCECVYKHFKDRRADARRDSDIGFSTHMYVESERRSLEGRRGYDKEA